MLQNFELPTSIVQICGNTQGHQLDKNMDKKINFQQF